MPRNKRKRKAMGFGTGPLLDIFLGATIIKNYGIQGGSS